MINEMIELLCDIEYSGSQCWLVLAETCARGGDVNGCHAVVDRAHQALMLSSSSSSSSSSLPLKSNKKVQANNNGDNNAGDRGLNKVGGSRDGMLGPGLGLGPRQQQGLGQGEVRAQLWWWLLEAYERAGRVEEGLELTMR